MGFKFKLQDIVKIKDEVYKQEKYKIYSSEGFVILRCESSEGIFYRLNLELKGTGDMFSVLVKEEDITFLGNIKNA